jgi:uncharacterized protein YdaU (DUF1376 family)
VNYYPFHIGDYISHTSHLTDEEDLAYRRMIDLYYMTEEPFTDIVWVARKVKSTPVIIETLLKEFFEYWMEDCTWRNKRADEEIAKYRLKADSARNANRIKSAKITAMKSELKSEPNHIVTKNQEPRTNIKTLPTPEGVSNDLWSDFLAYRKRLKAPVTDRVVSRLLKESKDANMTLEQALETMIFKGWRSFEAKWITKEVKPKQAWE